jgi:nucleoid DNA-binding protein
MTKAEFIDNLAKRLECSRPESERVLEAVLETLKSALVKDEKVDFRGLGSFKVRQSKSRQGRNPKTGETIMIPARRAAAFRPGKELTGLLNSSDPPAGQVPDEHQS